MKSDRHDEQNIPEAISKDPDLILLDRFLTKAGGVAFPPPPKLPDATNDQVERLMKATESIRNPAPSISEDPDLILLDRVLTKTGGAVFPPQTKLPEATDEQVRILMDQTEDIRNPGPQRRQLHFPAKLILSIAAVFVVLLGIGLRSVFAPPSSVAVIIDFSPPGGNATNLRPEYSIDPEAVMT